MDTQPGMLKDVVEAEKPYFDFVAYTLRLAAWFLATFYVANQTLRAEPLVMFAPGERVLAWAAVGVCFAVGVFLTWRYLRMLMGIVAIVAPDTGSQSKRWAVAALAGFVCFLLYWFVQLLAVELVQQASDRHVTPVDQLAPSATGTAQ
jgi:hypothetical protein